MNTELNSIKGKKVLVIGDVMLDTYHIGDVKRISPEAPVPVVRVTRTYNVLGGAANVARNLLGLGCSPYVVSLLGNDHNGNTMQEMFADLGIRNELFHTEHPTITKTRVIGNSQQVVRLDFETENECLNEETEQKLLDAVKRALPEVDIVVISDYGKGVCSMPAGYIRLCRAREEGHYRPQRDKLGEIPFRNHHHPQSERTFSRFGNGCEK